MKQPLFICPLAIGTVEALFGHAATEVAGFKEPDKDNGAVAS